eukprot:6911162-Alexandrium_andersonii.AAC.1
MPPCALWLYANSTSCRHAPLAGVASEDADTPAGHANSAQNVPDHTVVGCVLCSLHEGRQLSGDVFQQVLPEQRAQL